jgi:hypothetical protein
MKSLKSFLTTETNASAKKLVRTTANELKKASFATNLVTRLVAVLVVLRGLNMTEEVRLVGLLILSRFGAKGELVPAEVASLMPTAPAKSAPAPAKVATASPAPKPVAIAPAKPAQPAMAPARTLATDTVELMKTWLGYLRGVVAGKHDPKLIQGVQKLTVRIFREGIKLTADNWSMFFSALTTANKNGNHIIDRSANPLAIFTMAPVDLVIEYVFGTDGFLVGVTADLADLRGEMQPWMIAKANIVLDAVEAIKANAGLNGEQGGLVNKMINLVENAGGPEPLVEKGDRIMGNTASNEGVVYKDAVPANPPKAIGLETIDLKAPVPSAPKPVVTAKPATAPVAKKGKGKGKKHFSLALGNTKIPTEKFAKLEDLQREAAATTETATPANAEPEPAANAVAAEPVAPPAETVETVTATAETVTAESQTTSVVDNGNKPAVDAEFEATFARMMLEEEQKSAAADQKVNGKCLDHQPAEKPAAESASIQ